MKRNAIIACAAVALALASLGCAGFRPLPDVNFEWFNLSANEIWVTGAEGLPAEASPGRLQPVSAEKQLNRSESNFSETVRVRHTITIHWNGRSKV